MTTQTDTTTTTMAPTQTPVTTAMAPASAAVVAPGNDDPEHDARGIAVLSDPAVVPAGWNRLTGTAVGRPPVRPATRDRTAGHPVREKGASMVMSRGDADPSK